MEEKVIVGDIAGIQNFLYNIQWNKSATKRLKGRSLFIELLLEKIKEYLKQKLSNCEDYLISGGKFILICNDFDQEKFDEFNEYKKEIEEKLYKQFYGELQIVFGIAKLNDNFKESLEKAYEDVEKNKLRNFENLLVKDGKWNENMFVFGNWEKDNWFEKDRWTDRVCKFSRDRLIDEDMTWIIEKEFWKDFFDESDKGISYEAWLDLLITKWITKWWVDRNWNRLIKLLKWVDFSNVNINEIKNRKNLLKWVPVFEENEIDLFKKEFEDLKNIEEWDIKPFEALSIKLVEEEKWKQKIRKWFNKLAVLKWDIDDLGKLFMFWLKENNYKENYKELSRILDDFWKEKLYNLIGWNPQYKNKLYVIYAGWDDFVVLGRWDLVIKFYKDLLNEFTKKIFENQEVQDLLKDNTDIYFSGAINLFWPHDTFFTIIKQAEKLLEEAKDKDLNKNKVNIFGQVLKNNEFVGLLEEAEKFYDKFVKTEIVSVGTLRFMLDIARKIKIQENKWKDENEKELDFFEYGTWKSELFYHLGRNYKTKKEDQEKDEFRRYINAMLLWNGGVDFESLSWDNNLFSGKGNKEDAEKLIVMMSLVLYMKRDT